LEDSRWGTTWHNVTDNSGLHFIGITDITGDPTNGNIIYATVGGGGYFDTSPFYGIGVLQSTDGGATWNSIYQITPKVATPSYRVIIDPTNTNRLYAAIGNKVFRLVKSGSSWTPTELFHVEANCANLPRYVKDIEMKPGSPDTLYIGTDDKCWKGFRSAQLWRVIGATTDTPTQQRLDILLPTNGDTLHSERFEITVTPQNPNSIYVINDYFPNNQGKYLTIWKSIDNGVTWVNKIMQDQSAYYSTSLLGGGRVDYYKMEFLISPTDTNVMYIGGNTMTRMVNWVNSYTQGYNTTPNYHVDTRDSKIIKGSAYGTGGQHDIIFCGNDGGISKTTNGINSWSNLNGIGLMITQFEGIGGSNKLSGWIGGGAVDNGFFVNLNDNWQRTDGGDKGRTVVDFEQPNYVFVNNWNFSNQGVFPLMRSNNYGASFNKSVDATPGEGSAVNKPITLNPKNSRNIYTGAYDLYRTYTARDSMKFLKIPVHINYNYTAIDSGQVINCISIAKTDTSCIVFSYGGPHDGIPKRKHKLLRTPDRGLTFTDLLDITQYPANTDLYNAVNSLSITGIETSTIDANKIWVSLGGFDTWAAPGNVGKRVFFSSNGGTSFTDISAGLPNFPVNCIKYWTGGDDRLFVGTDVGVYYKDNNLGQWQPFNTGLPIPVISSLEIIDTIPVIRASTFGRGFWESNLTCNYASDTLIIAHDTTWSQPATMFRSVLIKAPAVLTITSTIKFPPLAKMYVEPGAKLIVNGGKLTNACFTMWQGIEVMGNPNLPQTPLTNQGYASFINGAVVENARIAVSTRSGIISASNSLFLNNYKAIQFWWYDKTNSSAFINVTFKIDRQLIDGSTIPSDFVSIYYETGPTFLGCKFKNDLTSQINVPIQNRGNGIRTVDASFRIDELCTSQTSPCTSSIPTEFSGLHYGVYSINSDPNRQITINKTNFINNARGVYLANANNARITSNSFTIPLSSSNYDTCYGLYLGTCSGYHVEDNNFSAPGNSLYFSQSLREIGLIVDNSGGASNEIYRNHFETLDIAINAQRVNRQDGGAITLDLGGIPPYPIAIPTGLLLKCNTYNNNIYDEMATRRYSYGLEGIAKNQGANTIYRKDQAGNTFSPYHVQAQIPESDIKNTADNIIYYHQIPPSGLRVKPEYYTPEPKVVRQQVNNNFIYNQCCPSKLTSPNPTPLNLRVVLSQEGTLINALINQLKDLVDDGNTDEMNDNIVYSIPPDAIDVRQDLLNGSPYLSDSVMKSAIAKESVLPNEMIRDVLVANPQSAKTDDVLNTLNDRFIPMPDSMMAEIMDGKDQLSPKEELEAQIAVHVQYFKDAYNELVRFYLTDSTASESADSIINFLESVSDLDGKYLLASKYLSIGDTTSMDNALNSILSTFTLDRLRQQQYLDYQTYFSFLKSLRAQNKDILQIDSSQITQLVTLYDQASEPVSSYVRNILIANNLINYFEPIIIPDDLKSSPEENVFKTSHFSEGCYLKVFPNPAKHYIIAEYNTQQTNAGNNELILTITSSDGKIIETRLLSKPQDQQLIETIDYKPGIYLCFLKSGNKVLVSRKFTIIQ